MFNKDNIKIFDYIFSVNCIKNNLNESECIEKLHNMFDSKEDEYSFWIDSIHFVNKESVHEATYYDSSNNIEYISFPKMTLNFKNKYKEYKQTQIVEQINNNGEFDKTIIEKVCNNMCNQSIKKILDYCEENGHIKYLGEPYFYADDDLSEIIYENIEANVTKKDNNNIHNEINIYGSHNDFSNVTFNQNINYNEIDDAIIDTVKNIIPELEEYKIDKEVISKLQEYTKKGKKDKLIDYLIEVGSSLSSSLIRYAINYILIRYGINPIF